MLNQILPIENDIKLAENIYRAQTPLRIIVVDSHMIIGTIKGTRQNTLNNKTIMIMLLYLIWKYVCPICSIWVIGI